MSEDVNIIDIFEDSTLYEEYKKALLDLPDDKKHDSLKTLTALEYGENGERYEKQIAELKGVLLFSLSPWKDEKNEHCWRV